MKHTIIVNEEKKTVVAVTFSKGRKFVGKAKCDPYDKFNAEFGTELAVLRMKAKKEKAKARATRAQAEKLRAQVDKLIEKSNQYREEYYDILVQIGNFLEQADHKSTVANN